MGSATNSSKWRAGSSRQGCACCRTHTERQGARSPAALADHLPCCCSCSALLLLLQTLRQAPAVPTCPCAASRCGSSCFLAGSAGSGFREGCFCISCQPADAAPSQLTCCPFCSPRVPVLPAGGGAVQLPGHDPGAALQGQCKPARPGAGGCWYYGQSLYCVYRCRCWYWLLAAGAGFPHPCTGQRRTANTKQARALTSSAPHPPTDLLLQGWSPERSMRLGGSMLDAVLAVAPKLR